MRRSRSLTSRMFAAAIVSALVASAAFAQDTGSMAYPTPVPGSGVQRQAVQIPDTGSMAPASFPRQTGTQRGAVKFNDIGSMQPQNFPAETGRNVRTGG